MKPEANDKITEDGEADRAREEARAMAGERLAKGDEGRNERAMADHHKRRAREAHLLELGGEGERAPEGEEGEDGAEITEIFELGLDAPPGESDEIEA